jgi:hypothetical protein
MENNSRKLRPILTPSLDLQLGRIITEPVGENIIIGASERRQLTMRRKVEIARDRLDLFIVFKTPCKAIL